jgi:hypothetical protein
MRAASRAWQAATFLLTLGTPALADIPPDPPPHAEAAGGVAGQGLNMGMVGIAAVAVVVVVLAALFLLRRRPKG